MSHEAPHEAATPPSEREIKQQLLAIAEEAKGASLLLQAGFKLRHPALFEDAIKAFGSWESVLAELVMVVRDKEAFLNAPEIDESATSNGAEDDGLRFPDRSMAPEAAEPMPTITAAGELVILEIDALPIQLQPAPLPEACGSIAAISHQGPRADLILFSTTGHYFGMVHDFLPSLDDLAAGASLHQRLDLAEGEQIFHAISRNQFHRDDQRLYHVTRGGKGKATELTEYALQFGRTGREAFLTKDDDVPLAVLIGSAFDGLFCASAQGQGIHMGTGDIRSMGRKSVGVNVMKLSGADDSIVSAFLTEGVSEVAVMTALGYGKRLAFREFRRQGRGGAGMQVLRLNPHDRVIGVVPISPNDDLILTTDQARYWRFPAEILPQMGRPARGKRLFALDDDEQVVALAPLPCGGNPVEESD